MHLSAAGWMMIITVAGIAGVALYGTYDSVRRATSPRECRFMLGLSVASWLLLLLFWWLVYALPGYYRLLVLLGYFVLTPILLYQGGGRRQKIQREEASRNTARSPADRAV